jgi:hypothetical protein
LSQMLWTWKSLTLIGKSAQDLVKLPSLNFFKAS